MYRVLTSKSEIAKAQRKLFSHIASGKKFPGKSVGFQGGAVNIDVYWHETLDIWGGQDDLENRYWTVFGVQNPREVSSLSISVEINSPVKGYDRRIQGIFLEDEEGAVHLGHRGKINLVKKAEFRKQFRTGKRGEWVRARDNGGECEVLRIYPVDDPDILANIADFVEEVQRIKDRRPAVQGKPKMPAEKTSDPMDKSYNEEFEGESVYVHGRDPVVTIRRHGEIANTLRDEVESHFKARGLDVRISNNPYDLLLVSNNRCVAIFECKTYADPTSIHTAIGQLLLYSLSLKETPHKIAVLPEEASEEITENLRRLGLSVLRYDYQHGKVRFIGFGKIMDSIFERS